MEEFEASNGNAAETLAKEFAKEKNDIVCGFLKEKELIEMMHKEEVNNLIQKFEQDKESMRNEFELEKEDLLQGFQTQQVEKINEFQREREKMEAKQAKDCQSLETTKEMKYKEEQLKMRREYEEVIAEKNEEIKTLRRELLRAQHQGGDVTRASPDNDIYIKRIEHEDELRRISDDFEIEKLEIERKCDREKAELVQVFANQAERMNANFDDEKQRIQQDHQKELEFKLDVTERLLSEKSDLERKRMIQQFEREITELQESLEVGFKERLLEKQEAIDDLEKEKKELLNALQTERFSLAQVYNREMSLLTNPDQVTKEDVEVALIDEIAKLKQEHDDALIEMEGQHKQKIEVIKRGQQPTKELERRHSKEIEKLKKEFENEKERLEAEFRNEQFNLLKSFEFERNDLEQRYDEIINEKELEIQQREDDMRRMYEGDIEELKSIVTKQREELEVSKQKLGDLAGEMEEYVSEKNRIEEKFHKENNQCQNLEQTMEKNLRTFEKNLKEAEALHEKEIAKNVEIFSREKNQLREQLENEKLYLQREIETLKARLDEVQMASENAIVSSSENILESDLVVNNVADEEGSYITAGEESKTVGTKSPLEEIERGKGPLNEREGVNEPLEKTEGEDEERAQRNRNEDVNKFLREIREKLKKCISIEEKKDTLEDLQMSNKQMKDELNHIIVEIDNLCDSKGEYEVSLEDELTFSLEDQLLTLEDILKEDDADGKSEKSRKDQMNEKVKDILKNAHRCHEVEKLKLKEEHQEEIKNVMKEVANEKRARVQDSLEALKLLQELDKNGDQSLNFVALKSTEERGTLTDDLDNNNKKDDSSPTRTRREVKENDAHVPSDIVEELRREKEEMKRSIDELEKSFTKEKEELMEKLQTQHKEFVMSTEGEIIENLLKQKSTLEEAFNLERFYLSRLYYLEMKDELEDVLCRKKEKMKRDFDREKMDIVLKYESEIADLHSLLSEKGEMELRLLQERNDTMRKLLASQKRKSPEKGEGEDKRNENEQLEREKENLEVTIPLKKEIAELQNKRHQEHETAVANFKDAIDLIKDIISSPPSISQEDDQQLDRYSFISEDPVCSAVNSPEEKSSENNLKSGRRLLLSEDEIRSKDELKAALENLVDLVVNDDEDSVYESDTTSGACSDLESEESGPTTVNGESDEGAFSGPESTDGDTLKIKKAELDFVFNLERFNLGRVYYGEYRDSLKKALKKLAKAKDSLRNKRKDLENDLLSGIKKLVDRTQFGKENKQVHSPDIITSGVEEAVITDNEDRTKDDIDGTQLTATKKEDNKAASESGDDEAYQEEEKKKENFQDTFPNKQDHPRSEKDIESATDGDKIKADTEPEIERELTQENEEHPGWMVKKSGLLEDKADDGRATKQRENISPSLEVTESKGLQDNTEKEHHSEAEMKLKDVSFKKPLRKDDQVTMSDRGEFSRGKKDEEEDADAEPHANEDNFTEEAKLPNQNNERLMEDIGEASLGNKDDTELYAKEDILPEPGHRSTEDKREASQGIKDADKDNGEEQAARDSILTKDEGVTEIEAGEGKDGLDGDISDYEAKQEKEQPVIHKEDQAHKPLDEDKWVATDREGEIKEAGKIDQKNETTEDHHESEVQPKGDSKVVDADELKVKLKPSDETPKEDKPQLEGNEKHDNFEDIVDENLSAESEGKDNVPRLSDKSDVLSQATDEANEEVSRKRRPSPVNDQDLIKQLNRNNKVLQDKFNLLCELVGKAFVKEIPELNDEKEKDGGYLVALENLNDLYTEKERLKDELKQVDSQIKEITATGNDKLRDLNKRLDDEEMQLLHSLREIDKHLKTNDDKELLEHLLKEKEEVCTKLDEINSLLNEQKEAMIELGTKDTHTVPGLMCKKDVLNDDLCEKARQLSHKTKMLEVATKAAGKEKEKLRNALNSLNAQLAALVDGMLESEINTYPHGTNQSNNELPPEIASLVKSETDTENDRAKLEKEIKKTENDIGRYFRILEEQRNRLQPFQRKRARIKESLDWANSIAGTKGETISRQNEDDDAEEPVKNKTEALLAEKTTSLDRDEAAGEKQREIENKIEQLDLTIGNLELPHELEQEFTEEILIADKMGIANRVKLRTEEDLKCLEEKIVEEQAKLNEAGFSDTITLTQHLVEKEYLTKELAKFDKYPSTVDGSMGEANLPLVKQLKNLLSRKESLEEKVQKLEVEISDDQHNFIDARQFKSTGNVNAESVSTIKKLIDTKAKSMAGLQDTNEKILQSLSAGGLKGPQSELIEECVERKVKLEDEIDKLQDKIDDETVRAAEMLADLLEQKSAISEELQNTSESATEEAKKLQENVSCYDNIPEEIDELISQALQEPENTAAVTQDRKELHQRQREMEAIVKEKAESLREAKRQEQDPDEVEDALEQVIRNKIPVDKRLHEMYDDENGDKRPTLQLPSTSRKHKERPAEASKLEDDQGKDDDTIDQVIDEKTSLDKSIQKGIEHRNYGSEAALPLSKTYVKDEVDTGSKHSDDNLDEKCRELQESLHETENRLCSMLQVSRSSEPSDGIEKDHLEKLKSLAAEKVKLEKCLQQTELLEDLLNKKETLLQQQLCSKDAGEEGFERKTQQKSELKKLNKLIERRENEMEKMEMKKDGKEKVRDQLNREKEILDEKLEHLKESIEKAKKDVEAALDEVTTNINEHEKCSSEEVEALQQQLQFLQNETELCNNEVKEIDKELTRLKKESRQRKDAIPGDVLDLEKLIIEKENLREYLAEIDATLDNSQADASEHATPAKIEELRKQKNEVEIKLEEIRNEKAKLDVEFEDDEMDEEVKELTQRKNELEERKREVSDQIRGSGVVGKLAEKRKKHESKMPRYYIQGILDDMARDEKTLTELIKEQEDLKEASQRKSESLEDVIDLLKSKIGEDLVNIITSLGSDYIQSNREKEYQPGIDEVQGNEATISDILSDLSAENKELRDMNGELSSNLERLQEKIGEEIVGALLNQNLPNNDLEFGDVISALQGEKETMSSILHKHKEEKDFIEDTLGKDLLNSILRTEDPLDKRNQADSALGLAAPAIMRKYDEDLENVIAVYEKELGKLSHENDLLKEKLGKDLSRALLQMSKGMETPVDIDKTEQEKTQDGKTCLDEIQFEEEPPSVDVRQDIRSPSIFEGCTSYSQEGSDSDYMFTGRTDTGSESMEMKESMDSFDVHKPETTEINEFEKQQDIRSSKEQQLPGDLDNFNDMDTLPEQGNMSTIRKNSIEPRLCNIVASYFGSPVEKSSSDITEEDDEIVEVSLNAPTIMRDNGNTLEEVIAQYENDLGRTAGKTAKRRAASGGLSPRRADRPENSDGISELDETMQGIVDAQEKNMEILRVLRERLGEDLVYALINETEEDHLDDLMKDVKQCKTTDFVESQRDDEVIFQEKSLSAQENEQADEQTSTEVKEILHSSVDVLPREKPAISLDNESDAVQRNLCDEDTANKRTLKAPSIALEKNKTLADVIESYEVGLDSLRSKLGPSLTNTLLSMEDQTIQGREEIEQGMRMTPTRELKGEAPSKEREETTDDEGNERETDSDVTNTPEEIPGELVSAEKECYPVKELRAPDIMATSGKTLEEVIEDYEERINEELNSLEKEVGLLKEKLGNDLFHTLLAHPNNDEERPPAEEITDQELFKESDPESFAMVQDAPLADDLKAKALLQDEGKTVEIILRKYERQLEELAKLVPKENNEGVSILDLTSNYEDTIADLENENKTFADRLANLSEIIGPDLLQRLENIEEEHSSKTEDGVDSVGEDGIKAPLVMQKENKSLENVLRNYEKELDVLRKMRMLPNQSEEDISIAEIVKDYEDRIEDVENRNTSLKGEHDRLLNRIGSDLVGDILTLTLVEDGSNGGSIHHSEGDSLTKTETSKFDNASRLNAPDIMKRDDSTLEEVLGIYEKALGLLPRTRVSRDDSFVDSKMHTFDDLKRENKILKDALGDSLAADLVAAAEKETSPTSDASKKSTKTGELNGQSEERAKIVKQSSEQDREDDMPVCTEENKMEAVELVRDQGKTIENILKDYEKELEALRKLVPSETSQGASVSELVKDYEDKIEKLENEKKTLLDMLDNLEKNVGPDLMDELQNLNAGNNEYLGGKKPCGLQAPGLMENESRTLEGVVKRYENELDVLRKLIPDEGSEASSISDIIKDYEDRVEDLSIDNKTLKDELRELEEKVGDGLVNDLKNVAVTKFEETESASEAGEDGNNRNIKTKRTLKAPGIMNEVQSPLEDIVGKYEQDLYNLARENKIYKDGLGKGLAEALLQMEQDRDNLSSKKFETQDLQASSKSKETKEMLLEKSAELSQDTIAAIRGTYSEYVNQPPQNEVDDEAIDISGTGPNELKATTLLRDDGKDLEKILKNYEKELDALRQLSPGETESGISISDLINNYESKIDTLEGENKLLTQKLDDLRETIGQSLYGALENVKREEIADDGKAYSIDKEINIDAINVMKNEDRNLENVVKNYEKELIALRKVVPDGEGESGSISDVIKDYEDKVEELQRQNEDLRNTLNELEGKIGSNLFKDLTEVYMEGDEVGGASDDVAFQEKVDDLELQVKSGAPEVMVERKLTLESILASQEKDINDLTNENKVLKDTLGPKFAETVLDMADQKAMALLPDSDDQSHETNMQVSNKPTTSALARKEKESKNQRINKDSMEDLTIVYAQPLDTNNNDEKEVSTASPVGNLKAESLIRDEGRTIENILKNYEKELEALTKLVPTDDGISFSDLVTKYEDTIEGLVNENDGLVRRLDNIQKKIGAKLLRAVENGESEAEPREKHDSDHGSECILMAPGIMQTEERTLENVVNTYEKELDVLRSLIPSEGQEGQSINDVVKAYEDKLDQIRAESDSLRKDSDRLVKRIGPNLVDDIKKLEEISSDVTEGSNQSDVEPDSGTEKPVKDLKVTQIMDVKQSTLEDVLETYENALGIFLSDSPSSMDELSSQNFIDDHASTIEELKQENDILKNSVGVSLSQRLLNIASDNEGATEKNSHHNHETAQSSDGEMEPVVDEKDVTKFSKHPPGKGSHKDAMNKSMSSPGELKAESLIKEEGRTIENILKNYEKELEALKSLVSNDSGQPVDAISNLVTKYEDEVENLKKEKSNLTDRIAFLEGKIGPDLMNDLENQKQLHTKDTEEGERKSELNASVIMEEENRTLETVINCYEKELDALRKLAPNQKEGQQVSISNIIKDYEDELNDLKEENSSLKHHYDTLANKLGSNLVNDIRRLNEEEIEGEALFEDEKKTKGEMKAAGSEKPLKAPQIMRENNSTLANVLETYEDALGLNLDSPGLSNDDAENVSATDDQLRAFKELLGENKTFKKTLGEKLAQNILEMAKATEIEGDFEYDEGKDGTNTSTELAHERRSSPAIERKDRKPFEVDTTSPSDELKANALLRDEGKTVENILSNYEKEIEALSKLIPNEEEMGYSISDLVKEYEEKIEGLNTESCSLEIRLESLKEKIGQDLVRDLESPVLVEERDNDDLEAPLVMQKERKTLENILRNYEKELEALRKTVSGQGENPYAITDMVHDYEGRIEDLKAENESFKEKLGSLKKRIGSGLLEDVLLIESDVAKDDFEEEREREICNKQSKLEAPKILQEKNITLEDVLETYETALSSGSSDEMMSKVHNILDDKTTHNLERENKVLRGALGDSLTQKLLEANKIKGVAGSQQKDNDKTSTPRLSTGTGTINITEKSEQLPKKALAGDLRATALIIDEGKTIENVLQKYERDLEALSRLHHKDVDTPTWDITDHGDDSLKINSENGTQDVVDERVGSPMARTSEKARRHSDEEIELLKEKVGFDLVNELLLCSETDPGRKQRWEALKKIEEEEKTLADILETYERDLERLKREKSAIEVLVNDNESDGQSALDIISQYEDEIEHLKDKNKKLETKLSVLIARMGDNLVNDVLLINNNQEKTSRFSLKALEIMEKQEKQLSAILEQYESDISKLTRENEMLNAIASKESVDGKPLTSLLSEYERKIQELLVDKHETEANLRVLSEKVGGSLANEILRPGEETFSPLDALKIMENEGKTLAEVTEEYENDLARMKREIGALQSLVSEDFEKSSFMDRISKYEDEISNLNNKIQAQTLLEKKVGVDLSRQLTTLDENVSKFKREKITFKAVQVMEKDKDITLADVITDYEEELEKKEHEILTLKELVSGDILEIATSQESEIDELKKVKAILANELDLISAKVGKELTDEIMKRSNQRPKTEIKMLYPEIVERMETEGKSLANILEDLENETKLMRSRNEELSNKEDTLTKVSSKIGRDLLEELLRVDLSEGSRTEVKPLFQASELMSLEEKTLGEVVVNYENELEKLKRENGALRLLTEKGNSQDKSVLNVLSDYEEKIEKLKGENGEFNKRLQKLTQRVGTELTEELLKLPDDVDNSPAELVNELQALKTLEENQTTLANVLQKYENRLKEGEEADVGPFVSGQPITEDVRYAQLVHVSEMEPQIIISEDEPLEKSRYLQEDGTDETKNLGESSLYWPVDSKKFSPDDHEQIKNQNKVVEEEIIRVEIPMYEEHFNSEYMEKLFGSEMPVAETGDQCEVTDSTWAETSLDQDASDKTSAHDKYELQSLKKKVNDLEKELEEEKKLREKYEKDFQDLLQTVDYNNLVQDEKITASSPNAGVNETDDSIVPFDLDLRALENLVLKEPEIMSHPEESRLFCQDHKITEEEIIRVEVPMHEEHFNSEYMDKLFGSEMPVVETGDQCEVTDSTWAETYLNQDASEKSSAHDEYELRSLNKKVNELEKELEEEKKLREKYEKDVQDLLQDIVDLKMKQAGDDDEQTLEETRQRIKEEIELKQDNKRLQEDLRKERKRRLSIEESKRDLLDEVDSLMRDKEMLLKQQNGAKDSDKLLEDMINLRKKLGELDTENKHLNKEVNELKEALSEVVVTHDDEKNKLLENCQKEKSDMMEELVASKVELETQLQELLGMNDDLKGTIKNLQEELKESSEKLSTEGEAENENECTDAEINNNGEDTVSLLQQLKQLELEANENERNRLYEKEKNEKLKEQLDETENALKQTLTKYQDEIKSIETEKAKQEDELRKEIEILNKKLQIEKASAEQKQKDFEKVVQREKERLKEDIETEHEREKKKLQHDFEDKEEELSRQGKRRSAQLQDQEEQWKKEREELQAIFRAEKEKLQKAFDEELNRKINENDEQHKLRNEEMNRKFAQEKKEIKATIEKKIYEQLLDKNIAAESDFQEVLSKILQEHAKEIEGVENDIRKAEERFKEDKNKLMEQSDSEKEALKKVHEEEKKALESTVQNLLKEVVKLKQQRKEIRMIHKKEKETMEEIYERDRIKLKDDWEQYKKDLLSKLQEDFDNKLANETTKLQTRLEDMKQELDKSEQRRKELEERLKGNAIDSEHVRPYEEAEGGKTEKGDEAHSRELKSVKKSLEEEYDKRLKEEKRKFEETLQGLRREIGNLQEKRKLIQDKIYNQDPSLVDRNVMEKSIANYKMEMLSKMEEEVAQKIAREKKPLEENIKEQQLEIDDLKRQRWELRNQIRRERSKLEEEFELERERLENQFLKEKEELKNKIETRLQREMTKRAMEDKVSRALSPFTIMSILAGFSL